MGTTALVVELLVVGTGAGAWLTLGTLALFGYDWLPEAWPPDPLLLAVAPPIAYVLGLVVDRLADALLASHAQRIRAESFDTKADFQRARQKASEAAGVWAMFEYGRSRMWVCRGWFVNALLIWLTGVSFLATRVPAEVPRYAIATYGSAVLLGLAAGCLYAWYDLVTAEFQALQSRFAG